MEPKPRTKMSRLPATSSASSITTTSTTMNLRSSVSKTVTSKMKSSKAGISSKASAFPRPITASKASSLNKTGGSHKPSATQKTNINSEMVASHKSNTVSKTSINYKTSASHKVSALQVRSNPKVGVSQRQILAQKSTTSSKYGVFLKPRNVLTAVTSTKTSASQTSISTSKTSLWRSGNATQQSFQSSNALLSVCSSVVSNDNNVVVTNEKNDIHVQVKTRVVVTPRPPSRAAQKEILLPIPDSPPRPSRTRTRASIQLALDSRDYETIRAPLEHRHVSIYPNDGRTRDMLPKSPFQEMLKTSTPLSSSSLKNIERKEMTKNSPKVEFNNLFYCPICMDEMQKEGRAVVSTTCGHLFCEECLINSYKARPNCPICQNPISSPFRPQRIFL